MKEFASGDASRSSINYGPLDRHVRSAYGVRQLAWLKLVPRRIGGPNGGAVPLSLKNESLASVIGTDFSPFQVIQITFALIHPRSRPGLGATADWRYHMLAMTRCI